MGELCFHKCRICKCLFYKSGKGTYCPRCIPCFSKGTTQSEKTKVYNEAFNAAGMLEERRARERARWHTRMSDPVFREKERMRSLARARAERRFAK